MPKRELVIGLSEQAQALNRGAFVQQQSAVAGVYGATQRRIWESLGVALAASLGIALLATLYAGRLEDRIRRQRAKDVQNTRDLQHLSAKLLNAQEEERRSIARELHDEVGQALTAIKVELAVAQRAIDAAGGARMSSTTPVRSPTACCRRCGICRTCSIRRSLDDLGLAAATEWYLKGFAKRHGVRVDVLHDRMDERLAAGDRSRGLPHHPGSVDQRGETREGDELPRVPPTSDEHAPRHDRRRWRRV